MWKPKKVELTRRESSVGDVSKGQQIGHRATAWDALRRSVKIAETIGTAIIQPQATICRMDAECPLMAGGLVSSYDRNGAQAIHSEKQKLVSCGSARKLWRAIVVMPHFDKSQRIVSVPNIEQIQSP
jgi:hypothetical protein